MKYYLRFFIDGSECTDKDHTFKYTHAARMLVPHIGEHVWLYSDEQGDYNRVARYRVMEVEYDIYLHGDDIGFVDIHVVRDDPDAYNGEVVC